MRDPGTAHAFPKSESAPDRRDGGGASDLVLGAAPFLVCVDDDDGIATTLWELLLDEGIRALTFTGPVHAGAGDVTGFLHSEAPQVIIFSIVPPYRERWEMFRGVRAAAPDCCPILTTTDPAALHRLAGADATLEIFRTPSDLDALLVAVRRRLESQ